MYIFLNLSCLLKLPQHMFWSNTCLLGVYLDPQFDWLLYLWKTCSTGIRINKLTVLSISKEMGVSSDDNKRSKDSPKRSIRTENFTTSMRFIVVLIQKYPVYSLNILKHYLFKKSEASIEIHLNMTD